LKKNEEKSLLKNKSEVTMKKAKFIEMLETKERR